MNSVNNIEDAAVFVHIAWGHRVVETSERLTVGRAIKLVLKL
jgi:hypothetical protein